MGLLLDRDVYPLPGDDLLGVSDALAVFTPAQLSNLLQRFLDQNPGYASGLLENRPYITPEEPGTVAVPQPGACARFDGSNDYAQTSSNIGITGASPRTIAFWANPIAIGEYAFVGFGEGNNGRLFSVGIYGGNWYFNGWGPADHSFGAASTGWKHHAITYNGSQVEWFINGVSIGTWVVALDTGASVCRIGYRIDNNWPLNGYMHSVLVGNEAYSPAEVATLYNTNLPPTGKTPIGFWPLQERGVLNGGLHYNVISNSNHLTANNITASTYNAVDSGVKYSYANAKGYTQEVSQTGTPTNCVTFPVAALTGTTYRFQYKIRSNSANAVLLDANSGQYLAPCETGSSNTNMNNAAWSTPSVYVDGVLIASNRGALAAAVLDGNQHTVTIIVTALADLPNIRTGYGDPAYYNPGYLRDFKMDVGNTGSWTYESATGDTNGFISTASVNIIPTSLTTSTQDAAGNALRVVGPVCKPSTVEVPCFTGDGNQTHAISASSIGISGAANRTLCFRAKLNRTDANHVFAMWGDYPSNSFGNLMYDGKWSFSNAFTTGVNADTAWHHHAITYDGAVQRYYLDGVLIGTQAITLDTLNGLFYLNGAWLYGSAVAWNADGSVCDVRVYSDTKTQSEVQAVQEGFDNRTNLVAHWTCQEGPGTANTNRTIYDTVGTNHLTVNNGTVANHWAVRCPYVRDWCIQYGGGIAANGSFVPGRIGSGNDAAGNAKTLSAGKHGNPWSRLIPNYWSTPELNNIGYSSSTKLAPSTTVQSISPADTKFARIKPYGSDRYFAVSTALTGPLKINAQDYGQ